MMALQAVGVAELVGGAAVVALGIIVARTAHTRQGLLVTLLCVDGLGQMAWGIHDWNRATGPVASHVLPVGIASVGMVALLYLFLVRELRSPLAKWLHRQIVLAPFVIVIGGTTVVLALYQATHPGAVDVSTGTLDPVANRLLPIFGVGILVCFVYGLATAVSAWHRAPKGTAMRKTAGAFALAFGARDVLFVLAIALNILLSAVISHGEPPILTYALWPLATLVYAALLGYGILRLQLFDIDLKIKVGIRRGTMVAIFVIAVFIAFQIASQYLNRNYGIVASGITTGLLLFLSPRLNKLADRVSNAALPAVQPTSEYIAFKKLEVYRAAVESAVEGGGLANAPERAMLDRLRAKLVLAPVDAQAIELEMAVPSAAPAPRTSAA
jgi:hypothetical protein